MLTELRNCPNRMPGLAKELRFAIDEVEEVRCMRKCDGELCLTEKERGAQEGLHGKDRG